jgi:hypothetical protein
MGARDPPHDPNREAHVIGVEGASQLLADAMAAGVPARLAELEERLELEPGTVTRPQLVLPRDEWHLRLEDYPAILVVPQEVRGMERLDVTDDGGEAYAVRYAMRVFVWARGEHASDTDLVRKRLTLAVREALLMPGALGDVGVIDPVSLGESYSDVAEDDEIKATIAAAFIACDVVLEETMSGPGPNYSADAVLVDVAVHPALLGAEL